MNTQVENDKGKRPGPSGESPRRKRFRGVLQIVRFNWPHYAAGASAAALSLAALWLAPVPAAMRVFAWIAILLVAFGIVSSLLVSHWVFDRAGICELDWIKVSMVVAYARWVNLYAGFDEFTIGVRAMFLVLNGWVR